MLSLKSLTSLLPKRYAQLPKQLPDDFQLLIQSSAIQPGVSDYYSLVIRKEKKQSDYKLIQHDNNICSNYILSIKQVERLYKEVRDSKVFRLHCSYEDLGVHNGSNVTLTIRGNGRSKIINMRNSQPAQLKGTLTILQEFKLQAKLTQ